MATQTFQYIGIIGKRGDSKVASTVRQLIGFLQVRGGVAMLETDTAALLGSSDVPIGSLVELAGRCDLIITVGGDGTLLNTARQVVDYDVPILGINLGRLGFLVDVSPSDLQQRLTEIFNGHYSEEQRIMLAAQIAHANDAVRTNDAFNDVVVHKLDVARMIEIETYINGRLLNRMRSDGLIISTPTGSTAYALSGGGPILEPDMRAIVLVPICPHSMSYRPIVIDDDSEIEVVVCDDQNTQAQVTCDGQINMGVVSGDRISIARKSKLVRLIHPAQHDHYQILRAKLRWSEQV